PLPVSDRGDQAEVLASQAPPGTGGEGAAGPGAPDLGGGLLFGGPGCLLDPRPGLPPGARGCREGGHGDLLGDRVGSPEDPGSLSPPSESILREIGRASCRVRV